MPRTKNPNPSSTYSDSSIETSYVPNFVLLAPPQPICNAKPLQSRATKMKHTAPAHKRRSSRVIWNSAAKNTSGTDPNAPIDVEDKENTLSQETEHDNASEKSAEQPPLSSKKGDSKKMTSGKSEKEESKGKKKEVVVSTQGIKRKQPDMHYWNKKAIVCITDYSIEEIERNGWKINQYLGFQRWEHFLNLDCLVYREKVREFYANAKFSMEPLQITFWLDGREFTITSKSLGQILNLSDHNIHIFEENWYNSLGISSHELRTILLKDPSLTISAPNLKPMAKLLHHISCHTLLPRAGTLEKVTTGDSIILYHLLEKKSLSLPFLMIHHMINAIKADKLQTSLPYGKVLTIIFNHHLFNFPKKDGSVETKPFTSKNLKLMGLGVAPREEQGDGKAKRQKVSAKKEDTLLKKEVRSKRKNDPAKEVKQVEVARKSKGKEPEKVQIASESSKKSDSSDERTVSNNKSDSAHSISKRTSGSKGKLVIKGLVVTGTLMEMFNRVSAQWKDSSKKDEEKVVEGTEVIHSESSGEKTVELKERDEGIEINPESSMVEKLQERQQAGVLEEVQIAAAEGQNPEKGEELSYEKDHASEHGHIADDELSQGADGFSLTQIQPSSPQGGLLGSISSPTIQTPIPPIFHDTMPTMPPFSPSIHLPQTQFPLKPQPLSFAPPTEPSPIPTVTPPF